MPFSLLLYFFSNATMQSEEREKKRENWLISSCNRKRDKKKMGEKWFIFFEKREREEKKQRMNKEKNTLPFPYYLLSLSAKIHIDSDGRAWTSAHGFCQNIVICWRFLLYCYRLWVKRALTLSKQLLDILCALYKLFGAFYRYFALKM